MQLIIAHGDVVTMNPAREVLVGGAVADRRRRRSSRSGSSTALLAAHPDADVLDARGCVVTPGMVNAHQHLTGDPLVRSCIPDLLPAGASIFEWSVPMHDAHSPDDDEMTRDVVRARVGAERRHDGGRGRDGRPSRSGRRRNAGGRHTRHDRHLGLGHRGRSVRSARRRGARPAAGRGRALPRRRARRGLGHARRPRPRVRRAARRCGRPRPQHGHAHDDAPLADVVRPRALPRPHRPATGRPPPAARRARSAPAARPRRVARRRGDRARARQPHRDRLLPVGLPPPRPGRHASGAPRRHRRARRPGRARLRRVQRRRHGRHPARRRGSPPASPATPGSTPSGSAPTTRSSWRRSPAPRRSAWPTGSVRSSRASRRTSSCTAPMVGAGRRRGDVGLQLVWGTDGRSVRDVFVAGRAVVRDGRCTTIDAESLWRRAAAAQARPARARRHHRAAPLAPHRRPSDSARHQLRAVERRRRVAGVGGVDVGARRDDRVDRRRARRRRAGRPPPPADRSSCSGVRGPSSADADRRVGEHEPERRAP